ncbi:MAG: hypothetical protein AAGB11_14600 [Pseudomonadota bacterium]
MRSWFNIEFGTSGDDILEVRGRDGVLIAGDGDDLVDAASSSEGGNRIFLGRDDDVAILGQGDRFVGGSGDDQFFAVENGDNILTGGNGRDQFWVSSGGSISNVFELTANDAYYTFFGNVSSNSDLRLLADKATAIGFPGFDTNSFLHFDDIPTDLVRSGLISAKIRLEYDDELTELANLIPASADRPVNVSAYRLRAGEEFDPVNGNDEDIRFLKDGAGALSTVSVGEDGIYEWDITGLFKNTFRTGELSVALSGVFGNEDTDGRNSYAAFFPVDARDGLEPTLVFEVAAVNTITDFIPGEDVIGIAGLGIGFDDVELTRAGRSTLVGVDGEDFALIENVRISQLEESDFIFA